MKKAAYIYLFALLFFLISCRHSDTVPAEQSNVDAEWNLELPSWAKNANIYEVNIRQYSEEGTFNAFTDDLSRLDKMGVDILWLMPVFPISDVNKKGSLGSYYAVSDFRKVNPEFGNMEDMERLINEAHNYGMKVILDWVPNHTGWDHVWIIEHPDYYTQDSAGNIVDPINPETGKSWGWTDVADLNYDNPDMREEMLGDMVYWVNEKGIDGFRMDVAHGVPLDFWQKFAETMKSIDEDLFLLAESQVAEQLSKEFFHMGYAWDFHHILNDVAKGEKDADEVYDWLEEAEDKFGDGILMHFTSNHDENSWSGTVFERMGNAHKAMAVITYTLDGMPLLYSGMEEPMRRRLEFFEKDPIGFENYEYAPFYTTLNELKHNNEALWNGSYGGEVQKLGDNDKVLAFQREKNGDKVVVLVNLTNTRQSVKINMNLSDLNDIFSNSKGEDLSNDAVQLEPFEYRVYTN